ncbi:acetylornithine aminotransferase [Burkholderia gladioli]|jgi:acetylornithine/N-succinyldiaminopimelate aminotransferase|uniref:Acetylornithine aminotransferase n=1 Tax=Burkholderia gladioli TaxID=28095 RepID=A0AAW3ESJ1_BURGA|nr:aspartate aminotransferase family protein [Burkholderia gladioli]AJW97200.1 succinylornithine transaminase family protein [Burkholderia gladioli]ASD78522.1 aspartate aminotransferase family protein [Burkholderia gladioli pv. gladioli]AWY56236.1 aspartate aminotransferase family protein [Burkholderia gladioli pv. gladioli]KGC09635.1 succinylornithine transaminase family protein [Burkholderia gladioli]KVM59282.1 acetylornithine aminotransferase [Burkholderia gladioli]
MTSENVTRQTFDDVMVPVFSPAPFVPDRGEGSRVWDTAGKDYVDFAGGIAVTALGHGHPEVLKVFEAQGRKLWHIGNGYTNEPVLRLARRLESLTFADRAFFANSGAEANEAALKLARRVAFDRFGEDKYEIVSFAQSFHGRTFFTVSVGGQPKYSDGFGPKPAGIHHLPYNDIEAARAAIGPRTCAVIVEPVQGEGGVIPADPAFLKALREACDAHGALLIFDEVQTGVGRTGHFYAYMDTGVTPDILTTAKALGNGFPIGAMLTTEALAAHFKVGVHGTTYGGNPLASAIADKVVELVSDPKLLAGVAERGERIRAKLRELDGRHGLFSEIRGKGLLLGAELNPAFEGRAKDFVTAAAEHGVIMLIAGPNVLRFVPSLVIPLEVLDEGLERFARAVDAVVAAIAAGR